MSITQLQYGFLPKRPIREDTLEFFITFLNSLSADMIVHLIFAHILVLVIYCSYTGLAQISLVHRIFMPMEKSSYRVALGLRMLVTI